MRRVYRRFGPCALSLWGVQLQFPVSGVPVQRAGRKTLTVTLPFLHALATNHGMMK